MKSDDVEKICKDCHLTMRKDSDRTKGLDANKKEIDFKPVEQRIKYNKHGGISGMETHWKPVQVVIDCFLKLLH